MHDVKRDDQMRQWVRAAREENALEYEDVVMWGVAFNLNDESEPPRALFWSEEEANGYAALMSEPEWHVGPYVLRMLGRNDAPPPLA